MSTSEATLVILGVTLLGVFWYAWEARKQAKASARMAEASLRPVLLLWTLPGSEHMYVVYYQNIGSGPAINISFSLEPDSAGSWPEPSQRVGMGVHEKESRIFLDVSAPLPHELRVAAQYEDVTHGLWMTTLRLEEKDSILTNMESSVERLRAGKP